MRRMGLLCIGLLVSVPLLAQKNAFKAFYKEGLAFVEQNQHADALPKFEEAYRLEPEAKRYKLEGTFFTDYLPRYQIALCHEALGKDADAEEWIDKSEEALEEKVLKRRNDKADYHAAAARIRNKAKDYRVNLAARYQTGLRDANDLLARHRYEDARTAFEKLKTIDPDRQEAALGLSRIKQERENYLKSLALDARAALASKDFDGAATLVGNIEKIDRAYREIPYLRREIEDARKAASEIVVAQQDPVPTEKEPDPPTPKDTTPTKIDDRPQLPPVDNTADKKRKFEQRKQQMRANLLATLKPYRQGEPAKALAQLERIAAQDGDQWSSYHWLKGVYSLASYRYGDKSDESLRNQARAAMQAVQRMLPQFVPDSELYPSYIIDFYNNPN